MAASPRTPTTGRSIETAGPPGELTTPGHRLLAKIPPRGLLREWMLGELLRAPVCRRRGLLLSPPQGSPAPEPGPSLPEQEGGA